MRRTARVQELHQQRCSLLFCIGFDKKSIGGMRFAIDYSQKSARIDSRCCCGSDDSSSGVLRWSTSRPPRGAHGEKATVDLAAVSYPQLELVHRGHIDHLAIHDRPTWLTHDNRVHSSLARSYIERQYPIALVVLVLHTTLIRDSICTGTVILLRNGMSPRLHGVSRLSITSCNLPWLYSTHSYAKKR